MRVVDAFSGGERVGQAKPAAETVRVEGRVCGVWIVVITKVGQETRAKRELQGQGFEVYLPMKLSQNKRREMVAAPFFPRYLFAKVTLQVERWKSIYTTLGVSSVLGNAGLPIGLKDEVVDRIKAAEDGGFIRLGLSEAGKYVRGQRVAVGAEGLEAVFEERVDAKRVAILVSMFRRDSRVVVDLNKLRLLDPPAP